MEPVANANGCALAQCSTQGHLVNEEGAISTEWAH